MFCKFCGSSTTNQAGICDRCRADFYTSEAQKNAPTVSSYYASPYPQMPTPTHAPTGGRMAGFGKALTAVLLSFFGYILSLVSMIVGAILADEIRVERRYQPYSGTYMYVTVRPSDSEILAVIIMALVSLAMGIVSLIFGISSIKRFKRALAGHKPIATLILGIHAVIFATLTIMFAVIAFGIAGRLF